MRTALILLNIAAISAIWELFARQAPGSIFYFGILPGPISSLRYSATVLGLAFLGVAWLLPWISQPNEPRVLLGMAVIGVILTIGANFYAAINGMYAIQIDDPRPDAMPLFIIKYSGYAILGYCLFDLTRKILFRNPP